MEKKEKITSPTQHTPNCSGIVQLVPENVGYLVGLQTKIMDMFPEQTGLAKLHITILHQSFPKMVGAGKTRGDKMLKQAYKDKKPSKIPTPTVELGDVYMATGEGDESGRVSTYIVVRDTQACKDTRDAILSAAGIIETLGHLVGTPEQDRVFHISLTNLTGNGGDSIKYPNLAKDQKLEVPA